MLAAGLGIQQQERQQQQSNSLQPMVQGQAQSHMQMDVHPAWTVHPERFMEGIVPGARVADHHPGIVRKECVEGLVRLLFKERAQVRLHVQHSITWSLVLQCHCQLCLVYIPMHVSYMAEAHELANMHFAVQMIDKVIQQHARRWSLAFANGASLAAKVCWYPAPVQVHTWHDGQWQSLLLCTETGAFLQPSVHGVMIRCPHAVTCRQKQFPEALEAYSLAIQAAAAMPTAEAAARGMPCSRSSATVDNGIRALTSV